MDAMEIRSNAIVELVNKYGTVSFSQIKEQFSNVSEMTLRTDLKALDEAKEIVRIHGGAKSVQLVIGTDDYLTRRAVRNIQAKQEIARKGDIHGFRKYYNRVGKDFSGSVQSDLYNRSFLCH